MSLGVLLLLLAGDGGFWSSPERIALGKGVFEVGCAACHGKDGRGNPAWESDVRPVELDDCTTTAEPAQLWEAIVKDGGAAWVCRR